MNHDYIKKFNLIDQYVMGKLAADEAEDFENHFVDCAECVEQLNLTRNFIQDLKGMAVQETVFSGNRRASGAERWHFRGLMPVPSWAVVTGCGVVLALVFAVFAVRRLGQLESEVRHTKEEASALNQQYQRELATAAESEKQHQEAREQLAQRVDELEKQLKLEGSDFKASVRGSKAPEVNFPIFALSSVARGSTPGPVDIAVPASSSRFALSIPVEDRRDFSVYRVTIVDQRGRTVWKQSGFRPDAYHTLSLSLNSDFLARGTYDLRVEGLIPPNDWNTVGSYPFHITSRR